MLLLPSALVVPLLLPFETSWSSLTILHLSSFRRRHGCQALTFRALIEGYGLRNNVGA